MDSSRDFDALVIGAGVAGLGCAARLADAGLRVAVLEARSLPGGRARSWSDPELGFPVDIGPHVITSEHLHFVRLLERLGTADQVQWQDQPAITLLDAAGRLDIPNSRWIPPLHGLPQLPVVLRRLSVRDALSHARLAWHAARIDEAGQRALDTRDAYGWLREMGVTEHAIDWFWRSALLALLNVPLEQCSAAAAMRVFRLMLGRSGYHFGFPKIGLGELFAPGCAALVRAGGGEVLTGCAVRRLDVRAGTVHGVELRDGRTLQAPWCVLAVAPWNAQGLLARTREPLLAPLVQAARGFLGAPYTSTVLVLDRPLGPDRFWARVWNPGDLNTDFYDLSNIRPALAGRGAVIACNAIGPNARLHWSDERVIARSRQELQDFVAGSAAASVLQARVNRIRCAIAQPRPGTEGLRPGTRTPVRGLLLAGDWTDTAVPCSMESAARSADLAAEVVLGRTLALPAPETYGLVGLLRRRLGGPDIAAAEKGGGFRAPPEGPRPRPAHPGGPGALPAGCSNAQEALALFDTLAPVDASFLLGTWCGRGFPSGHPLDGVLEAYGWQGKRFDAAEAVHPLVFTTGAGPRTLRARPLLAALPLLLRWPALRQERLARWLRPLLPLLATRRPRARLRMVQFRGQLSATIVYDEVPVQDVLRRVDGDTVLGLMDLKGMAQPFFFVLHRQPAP